MTQLEILKLEKITEEKYSSSCEDYGHGRIFGGQVLAQALIAAQNTVENSRNTHSLHAYFLRPGDPYTKVYYEVEKIRDGKSFTTRRIVAKQKEKAIFNMAVSFQKTEPGLNHQITAPKTPQPNECTQNHKINSKFYEKNNPLEFKLILTTQLEERNDSSSHQAIWIKSRKEIPKDQTLHQGLLTYASDFGLLLTSLLPHEKKITDPKKIQIASLDHAMWFHREINLNNWMLYYVNSPNASGARGLNFGYFFNENGELIASTAQEGLIRLI